MDTPLTPSLQGFWERVYDAHRGADDVDGFEVDYNDGESVTEFAALLVDQQTNAIALVRYILAHANELMIALTA